LTRLGNPSLALGAGAPLIRLDALAASESERYTGTMRVPGEHKLLVIDAAAMGYEFLRRAGESPGGQACPPCVFRPARSVFPALTCTVQASFRTASPPAAHGMVANGLFDRRLRRATFWEQSAGLVEGQRIWDDFRAGGGTVGLLFWQQSLGENADVILSPAPIHKHHGGMIQDCYSKPPGLYERLCREIGRPFDLSRYWGPLASAAAGDWIAAATVEVMKEPSPGLLMTYLPTLDYDLQRRGTRHEKSGKAMEALRGQIESILSAARKLEYEAVIFGDCAIGDTIPCNAPVFPNRALARAGMMKTRTVKGMLYPDLHESLAFALADHEIAHVYVHDQAAVATARDVLGSLPGVAEVLDRTAQHELGLDHPNSGELVLAAEEGRWFAYPWWTENRHGPDYASHADIHNKPGYDPCELFFGWPPGSVSRDASRIRGSHGRVSPGREIAWAATREFPVEVETILDLAAAVRSLLR